MTWPSSGLSLDQVMETADLDEQLLCSRYATGFLVRPSAGLVAAVGFKRTLQVEGRREATDALFLWVLPLRARPTSDNGLVCVGRLDGNDVAIPDGSVSKYHAFFRERPDGEFLLQDAGSMNGTFVCDRRVPVRNEGQPTKVDSGSPVRFGVVTTTFVSAAELLAVYRRTAS